MIKYSLIILVTLSGLLSFFMVATANAEDIQAASRDKDRGDLRFESLDDPDDPYNLLPATREREGLKKNRSFVYLH